MSSTGQELTELLGLKSNVVETITYREFLLRLKEHPEMADSAAATLVRAIESKGEVKIENSPPELRPYLKMLQRENIPTWNAFKHVRGSQRTVARILDDLRAAAGNGYQLRLALLLKGGPGSGKSHLTNAFKEALEGEIVYAVDNCPVHENPINLLNLLKPEQIDKIAESLKITDKDRDQEYKAAVRAARGSHEHKPVRKPSLRNLLAIAGQPCQHCWNAVMKASEGEEANLSEVKVTALRLSSRSFGIATWSKNCTLAATLEQGSRGIVDMPELFGSAAGNSKDGGNTVDADELDILLEATNDRQIPAGCGEVCGDKETARAFCRWTLCCSDRPTTVRTSASSRSRRPDKFTRRLAIFNVPYITSVSEEEYAYRAEIAKMRDQPHFDPMVLKITALLAVISRMTKDNTEVDIIKRARMYDGEQLAVERKTPPVTAAASTSANAANPFGNYGTKGGATSTQPAAKKVTNYWQVGDFWATASKDEGMHGLNMPDMLQLISEAVSLVLTNANGTDKPCISTLEMLRFLRGKIAEMSAKPGLTPKQIEVLNNCKEYLKNFRVHAVKPGLLEEEYRRVLKRQLMSVVSPDFDTRASTLFERYRTHANAWAGGQKETFEEVMQAGKLEKRRVKTNFDGILEDLETQMGIKDDSERETFRRSVEGHILSITRRARALVENDGDEDDDVSTDENNGAQINWRTLPKLAEGIAKKLNDEAAKKLERILKSEIELTDEDKEMRRDALKKFSELGYTERCARVALMYFNDYQLYKS
ncbi:MAG: hypothetical protein IPL73_18680 [Candidatus Obscuribacter sp.]|nr:hypothetical protein [Candidatus Obscuribacter sp.]